MGLGATIRRLFTNRGKAHILPLRPYWEITAPRSFPALLRALMLLFPEDSVLYLEGSNTPSNIREFLEKRRAAQPIEIMRGTLLPTPDRFHLPLTAANLDGLSLLLEARANPEVCTHIHVYREGAVGLQWYDASAGDPIRVSIEVPEGKIQEFCAALDCSYNRKD